MIYSYCGYSTTCTPYLSTPPGIKLPDELKTTPKSGCTRLAVGQKKSISTRDPVGACSRWSAKRCYRQINENAQWYGMLVVVHEATACSS